MRFSGLHSGLLREERSAQDLVVCPRVEPDQQLLPLADGRSAQVARRAKQHGEQVVAAGLLFGKVQMDHFLALGGNDFGDVLEEFEHFSRAQAFFARVYQRFGGDALLRKKLLRFAARDSPRAVIVPVYHLRHMPSYRCVCFYTLLVIAHS